jgi:hypothetical protein
MLSIVFAQVAVTNSSGGLSKQMSQGDAKW